VGGSTITIVRADARAPAPGAGELVLTSGELRAGPPGAILARALRFRYGRMVTRRMRTLGRPLALAAVVRASARGRCWIEDESGERRDLTLSLLGGWGAGLVADLARRRSFVRHVEQQVAALERDLGSAPRATWCDGRPPVYLRAEISFGLDAGGSVGHTAGVLN